MASRIHLVMDERERDRLQARAVADGVTLSEWLREAARQRLAREQPARIASVDDLDRFFAQRAAAEIGSEPDWDQHLRVVEQSRRRGLEAS